MNTPNRHSRLEGAAFRLLGLHSAIPLEAYPPKNPSPASCPQEVLRTDGEFELETRDAKNAKAKPLCC